MLGKFIIRPIVAGIKHFNDTFAKASGIADTAEKGYTHLTKIIGASTGCSGLAKGSVDLAEAVACQDGVCAAVSAVGCLADSLTICTNFIPGPNVSTVVTVPVSVGCKTFVWCCKRSKLPWSCR